MVVVTLIPPAVAALVGEYGRYDMKRAEVRRHASLLHIVRLVPLAAAAWQRPSLGTK